MSVLFLDGPAKDVALELRRAPYFLRIVREQLPGKPTKWDGLDQLEDEPKPDEQIFVYHLADRPLRGMIDGAKYRGPFLAAWYRLVPEQPADREIRETEAWRAWTTANAPKEMP